MSENKLCDNSSEECPINSRMEKVMLRFENKLDNLSETSNKFNTRLSEFLAIHTEQEKRFSSLDIKVCSHDKVISDSTVNIALLNQCLSMTKKELNDIAKKLRDLDNKVESNKTIMFTGAISGLISLLTILVSVILKIKF